MKFSGGLRNIPGGLKIIPCSISQGVEIFREGVEI